MAAGPVGASQLEHPALGKLAAYDQEHGTELLKTLKVYMEQDRNSTRAAELLYVHRTTLFRRLEQINELCRLDYEDTEDMYMLRTSFCLL